MDVEKLLTQEDIELPEIIPLDAEEGAYVYRRGQFAEQMGQLVMGWAAAGVEARYGESSLEDFAKTVDANAATVRWQRLVYKRLARIENVPRSTILTAVRNGHLKYNHLKVATPVADDESYAGLLIEANDANMSSRYFAVVVAEHRGLVPALEPPDDEYDPNDSGWEQEAICPLCGGAGHVPDPVAKEYEESRQ